MYYRIIYYYEYVVNIVLTYGIYHDNIVNYYYNIVNYHICVVKNRYFTETNLGFNISQYIYNV
jgi:hypothetical protein